jgi:hypothetical protein
LANKLGVRSVQFVKALSWDELFIKFPEILLETTVLAFVLTIFNLYIEKSKENKSH